MAIKAIAQVVGVHWQGATLYNIDVSYCGAAQEEVAGSYNMCDIPYSQNKNQTESAIKDAVKAKLIAEHGMTFGGGDEVMLFGGA